MGRFISADTIVPDPGRPVDLNRYAYVRNNPCRFTDPSGHLTEDQLREILGEDYDYLMTMWDAFDPYFYDVIVGDELQSGDYLEASMVEGQLLFQEVDGTMRVFAHDGAPSTNLWDWQGKGFYNIDGDTELSNQVFDSNVNGYSNAVYAFYDQPVYDYDVDSQGNLSVEHLVHQTLNRYTVAQASGLFEMGYESLSGKPGELGPTLDFGVDASLTIGGIWITNPWVAGIGVAKLAVDLGASAYKTFADPVYYQDVTSPGTLPNPFHNLGQ